jgi:hypothetical protein
MRTLSERLADAGINEAELAKLLLPHLEKLKGKEALREQLLAAAISGLTAAWSYEDRKHSASASQVAQTAKRVVDAVMRELSNPS